MSVFLLKNCNVLDTDSGEIQPDRYVLVEDGVIREVTDQMLRPGSATTIDVHGKMLMPGLIDAHIHATVTTLKLSAVLNRPVSLVAQEARKILEAMLRRGFTTVRDAGGADWGLAEAVRRGLIQGPRMFISGKVLSQTGGHGDFRPRTDAPMCACAIHSNNFSHVADGVAAVRKAAREELRRGANQIKIMAAGGVASPSDPIDNVQYSAEEMRAIVEEAESWKTYAMAHAYSPESIMRAIDAGVRTIEHANLIDAKTAKHVASNNAFVVPTLVTYHMMQQHGGELGLPKSAQEKVQHVLDAGLASLEICKKAGVSIGFGTDLLGETHKYQNEEFTIRAEALSAIDILRSATVTNAEILGQSGKLGCVSTGAIADLLVVNGNPLDDLSVLANQGRKIELVMKEGEIVLNSLS